MKKLLLASTALVLSAGLAHAQAVTISGEGRMGVQYSNAGFGGTNWRTEQRLTLNFNVSVQADHGLTFGAWTRARMATTGWGVADFGVFTGSRVWVESNGFRLTFGNQDGAFRQVGASHGYLGGCGIGYEGGQQCGDSAGLLGVTQGQANAIPVPFGANRIGIRYTNGDYTVAASAQRAGAIEVAARARIDAFTVAIGYTDGGVGASSYALSGHYNGGSWGVGAIIARVAGVATNWSLSGSAQLGGGRAYAYVGRVFGANAYGLNYGYGLGGGATLTAGAERVGARTTASVGVAFNF